MTDITTPQLIIKRIGEIITFKDTATGNRYSTTVGYVQKLLYKKKGGYLYARQYIPLQKGDPRIKRFKRDLGEENESEPKRSTESEGVA